MDRISFTIFIPDGKKFHLTPDWIVFGLWMIMIGFFWLFDGYFSPSGVFGFICIAGVFLTTMYYLITSFWSYKSLNGILKGEIIFENDRIIIDGKSYELKNIFNLDFNFNDYYGKKDLRMYKSVNPMLSQGVNNHVTFIDNTNQTQTIYFRIGGERQQVALSPFMNAAIKAKKMEFKQVIDLIGIENASIN
jgi:hypothetical protein